MKLRIDFFNRKLIAVAVTLAQSLTVAPLAVLASDGAVRLAGNTVFVNKASSSGLSVEQRTESIQKNLDNALVAAKDRSASSVNIVYVKGVPVITLGGYQVCTVDAENARIAKVAPAVLAKDWSDALKKALGDQVSVSSYVAQLTGASSTLPAPAPSLESPAPARTEPVSASRTPEYSRTSFSGSAPTAPQNQYGGDQYGGDQFNRSSGSMAPNGYPAPGGYGAPMKGRVAYAPAGLIMNATLNTSIATQAAQAGDLIQATISQPINLGDAQIPSGSVLIGTVTEAKKGGFLGKAGTLGIKFNRLRTPDGVETPISASIEGGVGKYKENGNDVFKGETWKTKVGQGLIRGGVGAGLGAALGTGVGAIAGGGSGAGRGAWSGTAIGAGVGVVDSLVLRKGKDVVIQSGQTVQVQLEAPASITVGGAAGYTGAF